MTQFVTEKQHNMMRALENHKIIPRITVKSYLQALQAQYKECKLEIYQNIAIAATLGERLDYLNQVALF